MTALVPFKPQSQLPAAIAQSLAALGGQVPSTLSEGIGSNYANLSFKGKVFRIKFGGQEHTLVDPQTNTPMQYMDLVILDAKGALSKTYYASGYTEGANEQPDCASEDGITPHAPPGKAVQCNDCRLCQWNVFGSKKSNDGIATNSKACADTRKLAVVPMQNIRNDNFGGPMLLRVPAASLSNLAEFDRSVRAAGAPFFAVVVRVTFDYNVAYPKLVFTPLQFVSDQMAAEILEMRADLRTREIIDGLALPTAPAAPAAPPIAGSVPAAMAAAQTPPVPPVVQTPAPAPAAPVASFVAAPAAAQAPAPAPAATVSFAAPVTPAAPTVAAPAPTIPVTGVPPVAAAPVSFQAPGTPPPPPAQYAPPVAAPPVAAPPAQAAAGTLPQSVLAAVDSMLAS